MKKTLCLVLSFMLLASLAVLPASAEETVEGEPAKTEE